MIINGSHFPSGGEGIICTAVGDIAAGDAIFAAFLPLVCLSVRNLDLTKMSLRLSVRSETTIGVKQQ